MQTQVRHRAGVVGSKGVIEDCTDALDSEAVSIARQGGLARETKTAHIIKAMQVVGMRMGEKNRIEPADVVSQRLGA